MKTSEQFLAEHEQELALLLVGAPKTGKTNVAMQFPNPGFIDADKNLFSAVRRHPNKKFWYGQPDYGPDGTPLKPEQRWIRTLAIADELLAVPELQTIVVDSGTRVQTFLQEYLISQGAPSSKGDGTLKIGGEAMMSMALWYPFKTLFERFIMKLRATKKIVVFIFHEKVDKDEITGTLLYRPSIGGQLADTMGALFTDVWRTEAVPGAQDKVDYKVRTVPTARMALGNSLGLPTTFNFTWEEFSKYFKK